ncbi:MAG: ABC transporter ATP-binding protein [Hyphomicrobiaceae bacterium]|nr:ABC transporter ATP-binding protein [Hyphomicrobiaceae bacterium]
MTVFRGAHIKVDNVTHRYRNALTPALADISLTIEPGESVALIGRSGCGKSTLLHALAGLLQPSTGSIHIDGVAVSKPSPRWVMMFQQPSLLPWLTVAQNIALGLRFNGRMGEAPERVTELLGLVELTEYADRNVQDLSGGQQQRVALARSLALKPDALLLDEPFSALDAFTRQSLQRDVRDIARDRGITLVLVTHDILEAAMMADRAFILTSNPGRVHAEVAIDPAARDGGAALQSARLRLLEAYEAAAGCDLGDGVGGSNSTGDAHGRQATATRKQAVNS